MALPLPNQLSSFTGCEPRPLPITALPTRLSSQYIDFLVNRAIEAAAQLPRTDEDVQHHCDRSAHLDPPASGFGLHERNAVLLSIQTARDSKKAASGKLEAGEVLAFHKQPRNSVKRTLTDPDDVARTLSLKVQKTENSVPVSVSTSCDKKIRMIYILV